MLAFGLTREGRISGRKSQMVNGCKLLSVLIAKVLVLKPWVNLSFFEAKGRSPLRLRTTMAKRADGRIDGLDSSGKL
jgi:hypothetical protein